MRSIKSLEYESVFLFGIFLAIVYLITKGVYSTIETSDLLSIPVGIFLSYLLYRLIKTAEK